MTDPVHIAAARVLDYLDGDAEGLQPILAYRPYLTTLVADLRHALSQPSESAVGTQQLGR